MTLSLGAEVAWLAGVPAPLQLQHAACLLHHHASAPNLTTPLGQWLPPPASPPRVQFSSGQCRFAHHAIVSPLLWWLRSCLLPSLPVPLPRTCSHSPVDLAGRGAWASQKRVSSWAGVLCQALGPTTTPAPPFHGLVAPPGMVWEHQVLHASSCCGAALASVITAPGSASLLGLKAHTKLFWGTLVAPVGTTRLAVEVAAHLHRWVSAQASWVTSDLRIWPRVLSICSHCGGWRPQWHRSLVFRCR